MNVPLQRNADTRTPVVASIRSTVHALALAAVMVACASEPSPAPIDSASHSASWDAWKAKRALFLTTPGRPMSYTGLHWIPSGSTTIGSDSANALVLRGRDVPARLGVLQREGLEVRFHPAQGVSARIDSVPAASRIIHAEGLRNSPVVTVGTASFRIVQRVDSIGVRSWDADLVTPESIAREIAPLEYFALDPAWRIAGRLTRGERPETVAVATSSGVAEVHVVVGTVAARVGGEPVQLVAYEGSDASDLFVSFSDETSGEQTYGFRFLHAALDTTTAAVLLDFSFAYNPDCAFSAFTTCPLPPNGNRIPVRIPAGERIVRYVRDQAATQRARELAATVRAREPSRTPRVDRSAARAPSGRRHTLLTGEVAPAYLATSLRGDSVAFGGNGGGLSLVNVWATWCRSCKEEFAELERVRETFGTRGLRVIAVSVDQGSSNKVAAFVASQGSRFPVVHDREARISTSFGVNGLPATYLLGPDGRVLWSLTGSFLEDSAAMYNAIRRATASR